jgi:acyl-CoA synthetase (AMP-forming)/AMP-acid ligase II
LNVGYLLANSAAKHPRRLALADREGRRSFAELEDRAARLAGALLAAGLTPGDRVGILFHNGARFVEAYFAALWVGLVATPVNFRLVGREMTYILNDSGARALLYGPEFAETIAAAAPELHTVGLYISPGGQGPDPCRDYEAFLAGGAPAGLSPAVDEATPCQIMYTSGTTGRPKGAVINHGNVLWNLINTMHGREDRPGQRSIIVGPLYHTAALNNHLTIQIALGGASILLDRFEPQELLATIQAERANVISGSPAMYLLLMQQAAGGGWDLSSITKCTAGADKLPMEVKRRLLEFFPNISGVYDVYGCTEASPTITILAAADSLERDGSVGRPLPFLQAKVVDELGRELAAGQVGEVVCRGPNVMQGYHANPEATARVLREGWLYTGDLARTDEDGFFYIVDRKKDMLVSGGENIYPREVEEVLYAHPAVADAAVVGAPDQVWGQKVVAFVQLREGRRAAEEEIIAFCKENLASYKKPRQVIFLPEIPRNASGKALKYRLQEEHLPRGQEAKG